MTLVGLISKNGILIVEFANRLQEAGHAKLRRSGKPSLTRLRPDPDDHRRPPRRRFPADLASGPGSEARNSIGTGWSPA